MTKIEEIPKIYYNYIKNNIELVEDIVKYIKKRQKNNCSIDIIDSSELDDRDILVIDMNGKKPVALKGEEVAIDFITVRKKNNRVSNTNPTAIIASTSGGGQPRASTSTNTNPAAIIASTSTTSHANVAPTIGTSVNTAAVGTTASVVGTTASVVGTAAINITETADNTANNTVVIDNIVNTNVDHNIVNTIAAHDNPAAINNTVDNIVGNTSANVNDNNITVDTTDNSVNNTTVQATTTVDTCHLPDSTFNPITLSTDLQDIVEKLYNGVKSIHPNVELPQVPSLIAEELSFNPKSHDNPTTVFRNVCNLAIKTEALADKLYSLRCYNAYIMQQEWINLLALDNPELSRHQLSYSLKKRFIDEYLNENVEYLNQEKLDLYKEALDQEWELFKRCMWRGKPLFEFVNGLGLGTSSTFYCLFYY